MVVGVTEWFLRRPIRSALDVGCGEAAWRSHLISLRPKLQYLGVDQSEYVVRRFGKTRNLHRGLVGELDSIQLTGTFDLIVCSDVLHYVEEWEINRGLPEMVRLADGLLFMDVMTEDDGMRGDFDGFHGRPAAWYRKRFLKAGLIPCGLQCYLSPALAEEAIALEVLAGRTKE